MLGPLPYFHRVVVIVAVVTTAVASGAWIAHFTDVPAAVAAGALVGGLTGLLVAYAVVHPADHTRPQPHAVRAHRHHRG